MLWLSGKHFGCRNALVLDRCICRLQEEKRGRCGEVDEPDAWMSHDVQRL